MTLVTSEPERTVSTADGDPLGVYEIDLGDGRTAWFKLTADRADQLGARPITPAGVDSKARTPSNKRRTPHIKTAPDTGGPDAGGEGVSGGAAGVTS